MPRFFWVLPECLKVNKRWQQWANLNGTLNFWFFKADAADVRNSWKPVWEITMLYFFFFQIKILIIFKNFSFLQENYVLRNTFWINMLLFLIHQNMCVLLRYCSNSSPKMAIFFITLVSNVKVVNFKRSFKP